MKNVTNTIAAAAIATLLASTATSAGDLPFLGTWDCEVAIFTFTPTTYNNGSDTLLFADDYFITLSGFTGDSMGWFSEASGDNFSCTRIVAQK